MFIQLISAAIVYSLKAFSKIFYTTEAVWLTPKDQIHWEQLRLAAVLNHTSLFEPLFISALPNYRLWRAVKRVIVPIADVTLQRPMVGAFFRVLVPGAIPITRKRDETWDYFVSRIKGDTLTVIFPEGRMKRKDGLDKHGKPMSVKGGIADILNEIDSGYMLICYSGGLHHVQAPGELLPRLFKKICITFEEVKIEDYKRLHKADGVESFKSNVMKDMDARMAKRCQA